MRNVMLSLVFSWSFLATAWAGIFPFGFAEVLIAAELDPVSMKIAPDGRVFVAEKRGRILVVENGQLLPDPFLDIEVDNFNERGMNGIALDPNFAENHYIYVYYTVKNANHNRLSRFTAAGNLVVSGSEMVLIDFEPMSGGIHNGGSMVFGADGKIYIATGDGADVSVPQDMSKLLGKVLRVNTDGSIPTDNPFYETTSGLARAIYAVGFRNPFSMSIQATTGRIYIGDVGEGNAEEVNELAAGKNYGWPLIEGYITTQTAPNNYQDPVYAYPHSEGCAIVGGTFYDPTTALFPSEYVGRFFYSDYCNASIRMIDPETGTHLGNFATGINRPLCLATAPDGTMYYMARGGLGTGGAVDNTASDAGTLWRVFYTGNGAPLISVQPQTTLVSVGEAASFYSVATGAATLQYQWQRDGVDVAGATDVLYQVAATMLSDSGRVFRCIVANSEGIDTSLEVLLRVTSSQRPQAIILSPVENIFYRAGEQLVYVGAATDPEDGDINPMALKWRVQFQHENHYHPVLGPLTGIETGVFDIPQTGELSDEVWYRFLLTATDQSGLSATAVRDVYPQKVNIQLQTKPLGLPIFADGTAYISPDTVVSVVGMFRQVSVPSVGSVGDSLYVFSHWSTGETANTQLIEAPDTNTALTAYYTAYHVEAGTGLLAKYYNPPTHVFDYWPEPSMTRIDSVVNFNWNDSSPNDSLLGNTHYMVRWEGFVRPDIDGDIVFQTFSDDGVRLWVNGQLLVNKWDYQAPKTWSSVPVSLEGGHFYPIKVAYFQAEGGAQCQLLWKTSSGVDSMVIPTKNLYADPLDNKNIGDNILFDVFPNPVSDLLNIHFTLDTPERVTFRLVNALGQTVREYTDNYIVGRYEHTLHVGQLAAGVYFMHITYQGRSQTKRMEIVPW